MLFYFQVYLANLRLKEVGTDVLITANEPIIIKYVFCNVRKGQPCTWHTYNMIVLLSKYFTLYVFSPLSESAVAVTAGVAVPAAQAGCMPAAEVFKLAVTSFKVHDWNLFGGAAS